MVDTMDLLRDNNILLVRKIMVFFLREKSLAVYEGDPPLPANIEETKEPEKKKEEIKESKQIGGE